jgi:hypothetical protein
MTDALEQMLQRQLRLQIDSFGIDPRTLDGDARKDFIRWNMTALVCELAEALQEQPWKPWSTKTERDDIAFLGEMIDAFHFWMNLVLTCTDDPRVIYNLYAAKADVNAKRQVDGYDESNKDAYGRALDEPYRQGGHDC